MESCWCCNHRWRQSILRRGFVGCLAGVVLVCVVHVHSQENPLLTGVRLSETTFKNWKYGHRIEHREVDCVVFIAVVVESLLQRELTKTERDAIFINNVGGTKNL